jgi:hypothetical protein
MKPATATTGPTRSCTAAVSDRGRSGSPIITIAAPPRAVMIMTPISRTKRAKTIPRTPPARNVRIHSGDQGSIPKRPPRATAAVPTRTKPAIQNTMRPRPRRRNPAATPAANARRSWARRLSRMIRPANHHPKRNPEAAISNQT